MTSPSGPHFYGIGAMRSGTTWTYRCLATHPQIEFPAGKQVHYWDKRPNEPFTDYRAEFSAPPGVLTGEITPAYAILQESVVAEISRRLPNLRVFFTLRDPVERAWSAIRLHIRRENVDPDSVDQAWIRRALVAPGMVARNEYERTIRTWSNAFGAEALLLLDHRQLIANPVHFLECVGTHIGVDPGWFESSDQSADEIARVRNAGATLEMPQPVRQFASNLFAESVEFYERFSGSLQIKSEDRTGKNLH